MNIPSILPIIYTVPILIPDFTLKIRLQMKEHSKLLDYLLKETKKEAAKKHWVGIVPDIDIEGTDECMPVYTIIGTVGLIQKVIKTGFSLEDFYIIVRGICRFKLNEPITEKPFRTNKIEVIANFKELVGEEIEKTELKTEFKKVFMDWAAYYDGSTLDPLINANSKAIKEFDLYHHANICLRNIVPLTQGITYHILRAENLNHVLKIIMEVFRHDDYNKNKNFVKAGILPLTPTLVCSLLGAQKMMIRPLSAELQKIETKLSEQNMPKDIYDYILTEFERLKTISSMNPDYTVLLNYIKYVTDLPWNQSTQESLNLTKAKHDLDLYHYGVDKVKKKIIQFIAVRILNPEIRSPVLCFIGPPGVGKTTIAKAIAGSLNRIFKRISLGGINHYSDIKGHRKTYVGSMPGCIIQAICQAETKNPVILLDEIDKMYKGYSGDPAAALLEVLDPEQNTTFVDSYINLPFDLSQVMFISTANDEAGIPQTLRDRMEMIYLDGYTSEEKLQIAENYLIPKLFKEHKMNDVQITITTNAIKDIIQNYTSEAGVRDLQRKLGIIVHYIAVKVVENSGESKNFVITPNSLLTIFNDEKLYETKNYLVEKSTNRIGVAIGLSWTPVGGKVQVIETSKSKSDKNNLVITGLVGKALKESIQIAISWIQSFDLKNAFNINDICVHVHLPGGGIKKDGPSAGITIVCAIVSLIWNVPLRPLIGMTGEISLQGYVLPVGGLKEKILSAYDSNIKTVIIPSHNMKDTASLPEDIKGEMNIIPVNHLEEVLEIVIPGGIDYLKNPTLSTIIPPSKL